MTSSLFVSTNDLLNVRQSHIVFSVSKISRHSDNMELILSIIAAGSSSTSSSMLFVSPSALSSTDLAVVCLRDNETPFCVPIPPVLLLVILLSPLLLLLPPLMLLLTLPSSPLLPLLLLLKEETNFSLVLCSCDSFMEVDDVTLPLSFSSLFNVLLDVLFSLSSSSLLGDVDDVRKMLAEFLNADWMGAAHDGVESTLSPPLGTFSIPLAPVADSSSSLVVSSLYISPKMESSSS
mmetsp:Transcript_30586/g.66144  ORF Transcript_30586/g.66144 Transcript_30586/m.66144 type:complete len:235 (-) Transcript_30586:144-848(-)